MAQYQSDLQDIFFNLFDVLDIEQFDKYGLAKDDITGIVSEFDKFVGNEIFPFREKSDLEGVRLENGKVLVPECLKKSHKSFYDNGWFALGLPEEIGGTPVQQAVATACGSLITGANAAWMMYPGLTKGALQVLIHKGSDIQKKLFIPPIVEGRWGGTMCLTESGAGSDVGALRSTATENADGTWNVKGVKIFISSGDSDLYENNIHLVLARTPKGQAGPKGISLFIVPTIWVNEDGSLGDKNDVICTKIEHKMGIHASATCELTFGDNGGCRGYLIGDELDGMATMFIMMNEARLLCGMQGESQANLAYLMAKKYTQERSQFGKEIINHPDVRRNLLRMRSMSRGLRSLCLWTSNLFDQAHAGDVPAGKLVELVTPISKAYCTDRAFEVAVDAVQAHGGYGYCQEYGMEQFVRDIKIASIYEGTNGIQAIDFVMRKILKDKGEALTELSKRIMKSMGALDKTKYAVELDLFTKVLGKAQVIVDSFGAKAQAGNFDGILQHCTDFLNYASTLVVAWRHMISASKAESLIAAGAQGDDKKFYETKITDFKVFCSHFLSHNMSIAKTILEYEQDVMALEI